MEFITKDKKLDFIYNYSETGCDVILINRKNNKDIKIEIKTRQRKYRTGKNNGFSFTLTKNEYKSSDFLIGYWYDKHQFFIVPINELAKTTSNGTEKYYFRVTPNKDGSLTPAVNKYLSKWDLILDKTKLKE